MRESHHIFIKHTIHIQLRTVKCPTMLVRVISIPIGVTVKHKHACMKDVRDGTITKRLEHCLGIKTSQIEQIESDLERISQR